MKSIWTENRLTGLLEKIKGEKFYAAPLDKFTSLHIGGKADVLIIPHDIDDLKKIIEVSKSFEIPKEIMGFGTNMLVNDEGVRGIVISIRKTFGDIEVTGERIRASAGSGLKELLSISQKHSLTGLEFAAGIPGSVGGAVVMNAGAYGSELKDILDSVTVMNADGSLEEIKKEELQFSYRKTSLPKESIVVEVILKLKKGERETIKEQISSYIKRRKKNQPCGYSAGSVFKNPPGTFAGKLIEECGLKGHKIGGVVVSDKHANFFINDGTGTACQMLQLMDFVKNKVSAETGIILEEELRMIGI